MRKDFKMGDRKELLGWGIRTDSGFIYIDKAGQWWLGGSVSIIGVALFSDRKKAIKVARSIRQKSPDLIPWTKTIAVYRVA